MSLPKEQRLKSRTAIGLLMSDGERLKAYPLKCVYRLVEMEADSAPLRLAVSVPKRLHRRAVDRILLKRRIKESFRGHAPSMAQELKSMGKRVEMMIIYMSTDQAPFDEIDVKISLLFKRLNSRIHNTSESI